MPRIIADGGKRTQSEQLKMGFSLTESSKRQMLVAAYFLLPPLFFAFVQGWYPIGTAALMPRAVSIAWWFGMILLASLAAFLTTFAISRLLNPHNIPLVALLLSGAVLGNVALNRPIQMYIDVTRSMLSLPSRAGMRYEFGFTPDFWAAFLNDKTPVIILWLLSNLLFFYVFRYSPFVGARRAPPPSQDQTISAGHSNDTAVAFIDKLTIPVTSIIALQAQDHYVKVYAAAKTEILLCNFGEAIRAVEHTVDGLRVHRSFWIRKSSAVSLHKVINGWILKLESELRVPVSRTYLPMVREFWCRRTRSD